MASDVQTFDKSDFRQQLEKELTGNILPFWMTHVVDRVNGGFYGAVTNDLHIHNRVPRSAILCARILWTYAAAHRILGAEQYVSMARWAGAMDAFPGLPLVGYEAGGDLAEMQELGFQALGPLRIWAKENETG